MRAGIAASTSLYRHHRIDIDALTPPH